MKILDFFFFILFLDLLIFPYLWMVFFHQFRKLSAIVSQNINLSPFSLFSCSVNQIRYVSEFLTDPQCLKLYFTILISCSFWFTLLVIVFRFLFSSLIFMSAVANVLFKLSIVFPIIMSPFFVCRTLTWFRFLFAYSAFFISGSLITLSFHFYSFKK